MPVSTGFLHSRHCDLPLPGDLPEDTSWELSDQELPCLIKQEQAHSESER